VLPIEVAINILNPALTITIIVHGNIAHIILVRASPDPQRSSNGTNLVIIIVSVLIYLIIIIYVAIQLLPTIIAY
jgi:hypothetical protein